MGRSGYYSAGGPRKIIWAPKYKKKKKGRLFQCFDKFGDKKLIEKHKKKIIIYNQQFFSPKFNLERLWLLLKLG